jgi:hypothetical protein
LQLSHTASLLGRIKATGAFAAAQAELKELYASIGEPFEPLLASEMIGEPDSDSDYDDLYYTSLLRAHKRHNMGMGSAKVLNLFVACFQFHVLQVPWSASTYSLISWISTNWS